MTQEVAPVMLPADDDDQGRDTIYLHPEAGMILGFMNARSTLDKPQHLYITVAMEEKVGQICFDRHKGIIVKCEMRNDYTQDYYDPIIAATDASLDLPSIHRDFLELWVERRGKVGKCEVEYENLKDSPNENLSKIADTELFQKLYGSSVVPKIQEGYVIAVKCVDDNNEIVRAGQKWAIENPDDTMATNSALNRGFVAGAKWMRDIKK